MRELNPMEPEESPRDRPVPGDEPQPPPQPVEAAEDEDDEDLREFVIRKDTGAENVFLDPGDILVPKEKPKKAREPMKPIDLDSIGSDLPQEMQEWVNRRMFAEFEPLQSEMMALGNRLGALEPDDPSRHQIEQRMAQIRETINGSLRMAHTAFSGQAKQAASSIQILRREAASTYPEIADRVLDLVSKLPYEQQIAPDTYRAAAANVLGEIELKRRQEKNMRKAATMAGIAGGSPVPPGTRTGITSQDVDRLRRMGLKGDALARAAERLGS